MRNVRVEVNPKNPKIFADRLFERVFYNMIDNTFRYGRAGLKVLRVSSREFENGRTIVYEDDGEGVTAEENEKNL